MKVWLLVLIFSGGSPTPGTSGPWTLEQCRRGANAVLHRKSDPAQSAVCVRIKWPEYEVVLIH